MSKKKRSKRRNTAKKIGAGASAGLILASVCTPAVQGVVHAEETKSSKSSTSASLEISSASFVETKEDILETIDSTIQSENNSTVESTENSGTEGTQSTESDTQSSGEDGNTSSSGNGVKPTPKPVPKPVPKPAPNKPSDKNKDKNKDKPKKKPVIEDGSISFGKNQSTEQFIEKIGSDASKVAASNDLYASVMIAQAILESASGNSSLAREPNYNLFGIKGSYGGKSVGMATLEDNGSGSMYSITANFRKYPSYKESLEDYSKLLKGGTGYVSTFYRGTWKSETNSYRDATKFLTGRYATDTRYNQKLNGLIETYDLQRFDNVQKVKRKVKVTRHKVVEGENLWDLSKRYGTPIKKLKDLNKLTDTGRKLAANEELIVKREFVKDKKDEKPGSDTEAQVLAELELENQKIQAEKKREKEEKQLVLVKASQVAHAVTKAVPTALSEKNTYKVTGKQVKSSKTHEVKPNETIETISKKFGVPTAKLIEWNRLENTLLTEGQILIIDSPYVTQI